MKRNRFSVELIVAVLKQAELGIPVAELIRKIGISEQTFYRWKKQYARLRSDQVRELKQLQDENPRLKKLVAEWSLTVKRESTAFDRANRPTTVTLRHSMAHCATSA